MTFEFVINTFNKHIYVIDMKDWIGVLPQNDKTAKFTTVLIEYCPC